MSKGIRRRGRELALKIIYSLQDQNATIESILDDFWSNFRFNEDALGEPLEDGGESIPAEVRLFAEGLVQGVIEHLETVDEVLEASSTNWALDRMARVDISLLRLAAYELMFRPDVPTSAVINEAIEIGKRYGTKETPAFVNGILDKISRLHRPSAK